MYREKLERENNSISQLTLSLYPIILSTVTTFLHTLMYAPLSLWISLIFWPPLPDKEINQSINIFNGNSTQSKFNNYQKQT